MPLKRLLLLPGLVLVACAPAQQIRPYTAAFKATPEQIMQVLETVPALIPYQVCKQYQTGWNIGAANPKYFKNSDNSSTITVDSINLAKAVYGINGRSLDFNFSKNGEITYIVANQRLYMNSGDRLNPAEFSKCIPEIFDFIEKRYQRIQ